MLFRSSKMAEFHWEKKADVTVAVQPVSRQEAPRLGILKKDCDERIVRFAEKPESESILEQMVSQVNSEKPYFGSMGIYLFNTDVLIEMLEKTNKEDFGMHIIPQCVDEKQVFGYEYDGYWADIGTVRAFYEVNLEIASRNPPFSLIDEGWPIYTHPRFLPGAQLEDCHLKDSLVADGCWVQKAVIENCVIGLRSQISEGTRMKNTIMMGADYYGFFRRDQEDDEDMMLGIRKNCDIDGAIIDKNSSIGAGTVIKPFPRGTNMEEELFMVIDGIVVIPKGTRIPPGTVIAP